MASECRVNSLGLEIGDCEVGQTGRVEQFIGRYALPISILVGLLIAAIVYVSLPSPAAMPDADVGADVRVITVAADPSFYFVDHELAYAGGYRLRPNVLLPRDASFHFLDHELEHAGGYGLVPSMSSSLNVGDASDPVQYRLLSCAQR